MPRYEISDLGDGPKRHAVYDMPLDDAENYWASVTDVPCPACETGTIRWNEAGYVPGSRICDGCGRYYMAQGSVAAGVKLVRDARFDKRRRARTFADATLSRPCAKLNRAACPPAEVK